MLRPSSFTCVNLPRWGLKQIAVIAPAPQAGCVNLPRWGLKPSIASPRACACIV